MFKKLIANILVMVLTCGAVIGGTEWAIGKFYGHKIRTYFEDQTVKALGDPVPPKASNEYRIFIFGGSTAYGFPLSDRYSITAWVGKMFPYLLPQKKVRMVNTAWPGKGSHYSMEGALNVLKYKPDLYVIYDGYNDVPIANRLYLDNGLYWLNLRLKFRSAAYRWLSNRLNRARKHIVYGSSGHAEKHYRDEVIANLVYKTSEITDEYYGRILKRFQQNVETIIAHAKRNGVDVLLVNLPANVQSIPPSLSVHSNGLTEAQISEWNLHYEEGVRLAKEGDHRLAIEAYKRAAAVDSKYAELQYKMGISYENAADYASAKASYNLARDLDALPYRAKSSMNQLIREMAEKHGLLFVDLVAAFERESPHGIVGNELIYDNVHPSEIAQLLIAEEIAKALSRNDKIAPGKDWQWQTLEGVRKNYEQSGEWQIDKSVESHHLILRAIHLWELGRYSEVIEGLEQGIQLKPDFIELYGFLGDAYWHLGEKEKALKAFHAFAEKDPRLFGTTLEKYPDIQQSYNQSKQSLASFGKAAAL